MKTTLAIAVLAALLGSACTSSFLPGRCDQTTDCAPGLVCNVDRTLEGNGRCVAPEDGGHPDGSAGAAGDSGAAGSGGGGSPDGASGATGGAGSDGSAGSAGSDGGMDTPPEVKPSCTSSSECPDAKPICDAGGECRPCTAPTVSANACAVVDASKPACAADGHCVVCVTSADCKSDPMKPICDVANQKCVACTSDSQCAAKLGANPGVCMAHQDGRCATDGEAIYVSNASGCSDTATGAGTAAQPFCTLEPAAKAVSSTRDLVVVRGAVTAATSAFSTSSESSIVGQQSAVIASVGASALQLALGSKLYARDVSITAVSGVGVMTGASSALRLEHVTVANSSKGGIQVGGGAFDISNSTISGNGPGADGAVSWGGIYVQFPPPTGPARLRLVTLTDNKAAGITCTTAITGTGVFAARNGVDINSTCGFAACSPASATCGAQP